MPERKSKPRAATDTCSITNCTEPSHRSLATKNVMDAFTEDQFRSTDLKRAHLCKKHYREYKRATKDDRKLEHLGRD